MHILIITPKGKKMHMKAEIRKNKTERDAGEASYPTSADRVCKKDCNECQVQIVGKKARTPAVRHFMVQWFFHVPYLDVDDWGSKHTQHKEEYLKGKCRGSQSDIELLVHV